MTVTCDQFLVGVKRSITIPANQQLMTDQDMLDLGSDSIRDKMIPLLMSTNQNFFVTTYLQNLVVGQSKYPIHYRAVARGLRDLKLVNSTNNTMDLRLIALEDEHLFANQAQPVGFYFSGDSIMIVPSPIVAGTQLKQFFNLQPNQLVCTTDAAKVTAVAAGVLTCSSVPTTIIAGSVVDFVQGRQGCSTLGMDVVVTSVSGTQIFFTAADIPTDLIIGDYVALAQQSPVVQLPDEAVQLLETLTGMRVLQAIGDYEGAKSNQVSAMQQEKDLLKILQPRIEGESTKVINRNGLLRGRGMSYFRSRGGF